MSHSHSRTACNLKIIILFLCVIQCAKNLYLLTVKGRRGFEGLPADAGGASHGSHCGVVATRLTVTVTVGKLTVAQSLAVLSL
jgi:hypothetical protein